jgi:hypothetical protein
MGDIKHFPEKILWEAKEKAPSAQGGRFPIKAVKRTLI